MEIHTLSQTKTKTHCGTEEEIRRFFNEIGVPISTDVNDETVKFGELGMYDYSKKGRLDNVTTTDSSLKATLFYGRS